MSRGIVVFLLIFLAVGCISKADPLKKAFDKDSKVGFEYLLRMAKSGNPEAMYYVGLSYEIGQGVKLNYKKAFQWYLKSANAGYPKAMYNLAFMYRYGYGTKKDMIQSYKWFFIYGDTYECEFDAQFMTKSEIEKAKRLAIRWEEEHNY